MNGENWPKEEYGLFGKCFFQLDGLKVDVVENVWVYKGGCLEESKPLLPPPIEQAVKTCTNSARAAAYSAKKARAFVKNINCFDMPIKRKTRKEWYNNNPNHCQTRREYIHDNHCQTRREYKRYNPSSYYCQTRGEYIPYNHYQTRREYKRYNPIQIRREYRDYNPIQIRREYRDYNPSSYYCQTRGEYIPYNPSQIRRYNPIQIRRYNPSQIRRYNPNSYYCQTRGEYIYYNHNSYMK
jgi:hypothetical protein